jgi:tetratricopeptide (TPR) repeat protein
LLLARLADMEIELRGDVPGARQLYQRALDLQTDVEEHPGNRFYKPIDHKRLKANYLMGLGRAAVLAGDPAAARAYFEQVVAYRGDWAREEDKNMRAKSWLAEAYLALGDVCRRLDDDKARDAAFKEAVERTEQLIKLVPASWNYKADLAEVYLTCGGASFRRGKYEEAKQYYEKCPPLLAVALDKDPDSLRFQGLAVRLNYARGLAARQAQDPEAAKHFAEALNVSEKLVAVDAESLPTQTAHVLCLARAGKTADAVKKADALRPRLAKDPDLLVQLAGGYTLAAADEKALAILREVKAGGYKDMAYLKTHPDLAALADKEN